MITRFIMMMRLHISNVTTSSLCAEIRARRVEPGRRVLKLQQQPKRTRSFHTQTRAGLHSRCWGAHTRLHTQGFKDLWDFGERERDDFMSNIPLKFLSSKWRKRQGNQCLLRKVSQTSEAFRREKNKTKKMQECWKKISAQQPPRLEYSVSCAHIYAINIQVNLYQWVSPV